MKMSTRLVLLVALFTSAILAPLHAQSYKRPATPVWDSGVQEVKGGSGNKQKISLRVWHERIQHADGTYSWYLNYQIDAKNKNLWGNWSWASQLYNLTYSVTITLGTTGGAQTKSGTLLLNSKYTAEGILVDGSWGSGIPVVTSATVTGSRYGGSSGISVTVTH